ncbi:unnamed protein product [Peronospora effusa]|nr:unnamed protein product [Peronospora effusa]
MKDSCDKLKLPEKFHKCLATHYGSIKRLKCEEHVLIQKTMKDMIIACIAVLLVAVVIVEIHWLGNLKMHPEENAIVQMFVRQIMEFCVETLREVHVSCLRPHARENADPFYPRRMLPRTGMLRSAFPPIVKVHVDRLQQTLTWLQMLSMSCLYYRNVISGMFFEEVPAGFELDAVSTQSTMSTLESLPEQPIEEGPVETVPITGKSDGEEVMGGAFSHGPLLMLDIFLKAGVLLPVETCDVLGVLYLKLLFDQSFKQMYTCHFVEWYPYFIELYLTASDENNEDGMRNLSRFIDRLFCQLFHSNAQLRELEIVFASMRPTFNTHETQGTRCRRRRRQPHHVDGIFAPASDSTPSSCVEWLMIFLLEKLNDLFRSTLRLMTILPQPLINGIPTSSSSTNGSSTSTVAIGTVPEAPPVLRAVQTVDCGRNVYKKRIYARLCSDLRTLLVHPQIAAEVLLRSYRCIGEDDRVLREASVYAQLVKAFELLQHMDLQTRHVHQHVEYESQNWTFAFVADYELKLLLSAFLTGIPACFSREVWQSITTGKQGAMGVITGGTPLNPLEVDTFRPVALARAILQPVRASLARWTKRNGRPEFVFDAAELPVTSAGPGEAADTEAATVTQLVKYYEQGTVAHGGASAKSFHFPLHQMYAALIHALCGVVRPQTLNDWRELLGMGSTDAEKREDLTFWYSALDHPLRVLLFSREIKAGLWTEECGLCRLPCDPRSRESSFGLVGMILPTNMPHKMEKCSLLTTSSDVRPFVSSRLPSLRVRIPGDTDETCMQLPDSVVWSCGHAIHHTCLKAYLMSLWKQKHGRVPLEMASGEDRLLSERDMEFVCPICRRLSNCLVPRISLEKLRERVLATELMETELGSDEEEEEKDDGQDPLDFLQWLDTQMSFRDDSPVVKRRRSRTQSSLRLRRRLLSSASKSSLSPRSRSSAGSTSFCGEQGPTEQDVSVEREIGAFCHEIVLRSVRAQLYLPTLLTSSMRDESSLDLEMQQLSSECGAQTPAWQLLLHCLEVQLRVVAREKTLLQTDAVDSLQLRSMRQLADITAAAVAFSTPSSLAWTVVEAPTDKQFESVMTRLNGLIFGQQVLFEEDDDACTTKYNTRYQLQTGDSGETTNAALVGTPILCHPRLLTCFAMRMMWRQSIATPNADVAAEQLLTEAFFSARILFTAQVLQSLAYLSLQDGQQSSTNEADNRKEANVKNTKEIRDFEGVESLRDASAWISLMLARSRLMESKPIVSPDMLLLMDVVVPPMPHQHHNDSQGNGESQAPQVVTESCAVCDGLFSSTSASTESPSASVLLEKCLRRLHLPPLRLFFHRQIFPSSQRALCQLWGAQLEAKAAVSRQQARSKALVTCDSPSLADMFPLQQQVMLLSSRAFAIASSGANYRVLIPLPRVYMDLFIRYNEKPTGVCHQCAQVPQHPGLCLFCGEVMCCFSACCESKEGGGVGECTQHAQRCGLGLGAFLLLRACTVILFLGNERRCVWGSLYVDKNGEEDPYLRRGKTLYLDSSRRLALESLLVSHSFSQNTAILQNTSRRDGRRY